MGLQVSAFSMGASSFHNLVETDRKLVEAHIRQWGVVNRIGMPGDFTVSPHGSLHSMIIGSGMAWIAPRGLAVGTYFAYSDGNDTISLPAANPSNPFIATVILRVADDQYGTVTGTKGARYDIVSGTPGASPTAPSDSAIDALGVPGGWMRICDIRINSADTGVIPGGQFTRPFIKLAAPPTAKMTLVAAQSLTNNTVQGVLFDTNEFDTDGMVDLVNDRLIIQTPGLYLLQAMMTFSGNATGARTMYMTINGSVKNADYRATLGSAFSTIANVGGLHRLAAGDLITLQAFQNSGGSLAVSPVNGGPFLSALWVNP